MDKAIHQINDYPRESVADFSHYRWISKLVRQSKQYNSLQQQYLTTSKKITGFWKFGFFLAFVMTVDCITCPARSISTWGRSTVVRFILFISLTPQNNTWQIIIQVYIALHCVSLLLVASRCVVSMRFVVLVRFVVFCCASLCCV